MEPAATSSSSSPPDRISAPPDKELTPTVNGKRLLMIDKNPTFLRVIGSMLAEAGAEMTYATSVTEARHLASADKFDAMLLSPDPAGAALFDALDHSPNGATPVVLVGSGHDQAVSSSARVAALLSKPVLHAKLFEAVGRALSGNRKRRPSPDTTASFNPPKRPHSRRCGVLIVEDNAVNAKVTTMQLEKLGCRSAVAGNGIEALRVLEDSPKAFELILMDCQMPEMDGFECTREIRRREANGTHIPVVALTANVMSEAADACTSAGMDAYISKPVRIHEIKECLRRFVPTYTSDSDGAPDSPESGGHSSGYSTPAAAATGCSPPSSTGTSPLPASAPKDEPDARPS
eukprot:TRINITY_DN2613_c0_g1_i1.p1 TRINITY_DN2613_c0_g1~~TRINITY_DN2613_c0_g1_i1.p1  ORF type:complete len:347 (-),score=79.36 TRINITY_DN2613_c0_g1_i1:582-1622(-)